MDRLREYLLNLHQFSRSVATWLRENHTWSSTNELDDKLPKDRHALLAQLIIVGRRLKLKSVGQVGRNLWYWEDLVPKLEKLSAEVILKMLSFILDDFYSTSHLPFNIQLALNAKHENYSLHSKQIVLTNPELIQNALDQIEFIDKLKRSELLERWRFKLASFLTSTFNSSEDWQFHGLLEDAIIPRMEHFKDVYEWTDELSFYELQRAMCWKQLVQKITAHIMKTSMQNAYKEVTREIAHLPIRELFSMKTDKQSKIPAVNKRSRQEGFSRVLYRMSTSVQENDPPLHEWVSNLITDQQWGASRTRKNDVFRLAHFETKHPAVESITSPVGNKCSLTNILYALLTRKDDVIERLILNKDLTDVNLYNAPDRGCHGSTVQQKKDLLAQFQQLLADATNTIFKMSFVEIASKCFSDTPLTFEDPQQVISLVFSAFNMATITVQKGDKAEPGWPLLNISQDKLQETHFIDEALVEIREPFLVIGLARKDQEEIVTIPETLQVKQYNLCCTAIVAWLEHRHVCYVREEGKWCMFDACTLNKYNSKTWNKMLETNDLEKTASLLFYSEAPKRQRIIPNNPVLFSRKQIEALLAQNKTIKNKLLEKGAQGCREPVDCEEFKDSISKEQQAAFVAQIPKKLKKLKTDVENFFKQHSNYDTSLGDATKISGSACNMGFLKYANLSCYMDVTLFPLLYYNPPFLDYIIKDDRSKNGLVYQQPLADYPVLLNLQRKIQNFLRNAQNRIANGYMFQVTPLRNLLDLYWRIYYMNIPKPKLAEVDWKTDQLEPVDLHVTLESIFIDNSVKGATKPNIQASYMNHRWSIGKLKTQDEALLTAETEMPTSTFTKLENVVVLHFSRPTGEKIILQNEIEKKLSYIPSTMIDDANITLQVLLDADYFIVYIVRTFTIKNKSSKSNSQVIATNELTCENGTVLKLVAVSLHKGHMEASGASAGHYTAYVKCRTDDTWYFYDDSDKQMLPSSADAVHGEKTRTNSAMYLYVKCDLG
jgi:hypothetical protein